MKKVNIREDMFYGTSELDLEKIDLSNSYLLFVNDASKAYLNAQESARLKGSIGVIIHILGGSFLSSSASRNGEREIRLGESGNEAYKLGLSRAYGGGEVRIYRGDGMDGIGYFKKVFLDTENFGD